MCFKGHLHNARTVAVCSVWPVFTLFNDVLDLTKWHVSLTKSQENVTNEVTLSAGKCLNKIVLAECAILPATFSFTAPAQNDLILMRTTSPWSNSWIDFNSLTGVTLKSTTPPPFG